MLYGNVARSKVFDLCQLSVLPGRHCWALYVDILILECGGNLFDAVSIAVKAAMHSARIPRCFSFQEIEGRKKQQIFFNL